jgi:hypothetical protein
VSLDVAALELQQSDLSAVFAKGLLRNCDDLSNRFSVSYHIVDNVLSVGSHSFAKPSRSSSAWAASLLAKRSARPGANVTPKVFEADLSAIQHGRVSEYPVWNSMSQAVVIRVFLPLFQVSTAGETLRYYKGGDDDNADNSRRASETTPT